MHPSPHAPCTCATYSNQLPVLVPNCTHTSHTPPLSSPPRSEALTAEALVQIKDLVRRYPDIAQVWNGNRVVRYEAGDLCGSLGHMFGWEVENVCQ